MGEECCNQDKIFACLELNRQRTVLPRESFLAGVAFSEADSGLPAVCGTGELRVDVLAPGMVISAVETFGATEQIACRLELAEAMYGVVVHLSYESRKVGLEGLKGPLTLRRGDTHLLAPQRIATTSVRKGAGCHEFVVYLGPDTFASLLEDDGTPGWEEAARFLEDCRGSPIIDSAVWTAGIRTVVEQMRTCPYCGVLRKIYLESKVLELLVLRLEPILRSDPERTTGCEFTERDRRMLEEARSILEAGIKDPPTIGELARMVGTNRTKLKNGFRGLFGSCVFEHLRRCRMEQSLLLLRDFDLNVNEVASAVGYSSVSAFSAAFHKSHGFPPREARETNRRTEPT